jgi:hypothetical protein
VNSHCSRESLALRGKRPLTSLLSFLVMSRLELRKNDADVMCKDMAKFILEW